MISAIVYQSNTGHSRQYAEAFGRKTGLPVYDLKGAEKALPEKTDVIFFGWLMAGEVMGYKKAAEKFSVRALCPVGMSGADTQSPEVRRRYALADDFPVFYLQGGFELEKLHGIYRFMMKTMKATVGKKLSGKTDRTPEEDDMLDLLMNGGNRVSEENLSGACEWFRQSAG